MRNLLALAALALLVFAGLGWYLGWYKVQSTNTADGHRQIEIDLNTNKIKADLKKGESKVHDWLNDKDAADLQSSTASPVPGTTTSFSPPSSSTVIFPGSSAPAPSSGPTLPAPR